MLTSTKIAFAAAIVLSAGSSAFAAPWHHVHHQRAAVEHQAAASAYGDAAYAAVGEVNQSGYGFGGDVSEPRYHGGPKSSY
jgi:uncharacterized protein with FMN-binding domain